MGPELPLWEGVARLLVVACLAGIVGLERELRDQEAGLRTHMLVGLGAALFVIVGVYSWSELDFGNQVGIVLDPSRVIAYVVTGIGFLGAGTIIKQGTNIKGLTTAASLWVVAAIGVSVGAGDYWLGVIATAIVLLSLWPLRKIADAVGLRARRTHRLELELAPDGSVSSVLSRLEAAGGEMLSAKIAEEEDLRRLEVVVRQSERDLGSLVEAAAAAPEVRTATIAP